MSEILTLNTSVMKLVLNPIQINLLTTMFKSVLSYLFTQFAVRCMVVERVADRLLGAAKRFGYLLAVAQKRHHDFACFLHLC